MSAARCTIHLRAVSRSAGGRLRSRRIASIRPISAVAHAPCGHQDQDCMSRSPPHSGRLSKCQRGRSCGPPRIWSAQSAIDARLLRPDGRPSRSRSLRSSSATAALACGSSRASAMAPTARCPTGPHACAHQGSPARANASRSETARCSAPAVRRMRNRAPSLPAASPLRVLKDAARAMPRRARRSNRRGRRGRTACRGDPKTRTVRRTAPARRTAHRCWKGRRRTRPRRGRER